MARRFSKLFCTVGILIAIAVLIFVCLQEKSREGVRRRHRHHDGAGKGHTDTACSVCPQSPIDICLSSNTEHELERLNPNCVRPHGSSAPTSCPNPLLPAGLGSCAQNCTKTWIRSAVDKTIQECFGAASKLRIGINPDCKSCMAKARRASNDHLLSASGAVLRD